MKSIGKMSQAELAAFVQNELEGIGIQMTLTGGACTAIYTDGLYVSNDIDFVVNGFPNKRLISIKMRDLAFEDRGKIFAHPDSPFFVDILPGPLAIGDSPVSSYRVIELATGTLKLITATDSLKDRLAHYFYFNDRQAIEQAILIAIKNEVDLDEVQAWAERKKKKDQFEEFLHELEIRKT